MKILITGGAGFIGSHTCDLLVAAGHEVRIMDCLDPQIHGPDARFPEYLPSSVERIRGNICSLSDCLGALKDIDAVLHLAARTGVGQSMYDIADYVEANVRGTATLVEALVKSGTRLRRFVLASSRAVYGEGLFACKEHGQFHPDIRDRYDLLAGRFGIFCPVCGSEMEALPTPEECGSKPLSVYAWTKKHQEDLCRWASQTYGFPIVILRYFNVYGSRQSLANPYTGVVSIFYSLVRSGRTISLYEGGRAIRDFVHVRDVARANLMALGLGESSSGTFNIGSGERRTIGEIAHALGRAMKIEPIFKFSGEFRVGDVFACYADLHKSASLLGYSPSLGLDGGLAEFIEWASGEKPEDRYDKTVHELKQHGLLGTAESVAQGDRA
jgi:dTDP-L-rhamnose 4-epimerase